MSLTEYNGLGPRDEKWTGKIMRRTICQICPAGMSVRDDRIGSRSRSEKTEIRLTDLHTSFRVAVSNWRVIFAVSETFLRRFSRPTKSDGCVCLRFGTLSTIRGMRLTQGLPYMMSALKGGGGGGQNKLNLRTNST